MNISWNKPLTLHTVLQPRVGTGRYRLADDWPPKVWHALNLAAYMAQKRGRWDAEYTAICPHCAAVFVLDASETLCPYCHRHVATEDR